MASLSSASFSDQYPYPSMINVGNFVSVKLTSRNYLVWEVQMRSLIRSQNLFGFIDGKNVAPSQIINVPTQEGSELTTENKNPEYLAWSRIDWLLKGWIIGSFSEEVLSLLLENHLDWESGTARDLWIKLASAFPPENPQVQPAKSQQRERTGGMTYEEFEGKIEEPNLKMKKLLHAIVEGARFSVVKNMIELMSQEELLNRGRPTTTALHSAACVGNIEVAKLLVGKAPLLPYIKDDVHRLPLHYAVIAGHREMTTYLIKVTKEDDEEKPLQGESGVRLLGLLMAAKYYGMALDLLKQNPELQWREDFNVMQFMAHDPSLFLSGVRFNIWQHLIYSCVSVKVEDPPNPNHCSGGDKEKGFQIISGKIISVCHIIQGVVGKALEILVPPWIKDIRCKKLMHHQILQLVKYLCSTVNDPDYRILKSSFLFAAQNGIDEVVKEILKLDIIDPVTSVDEEGHNAFHLAVMYRREQVFNILYQHLPISVQKILVTGAVDHNKKTIWHLAGYMARQNRRDLISGGILQTQRELRWFKEVENLLLPQHRVLINKQGKAATVIFFEEHEKMVTSELQWVQGMANSCTLAASLVATVVFAAAITVPGGNNNDGRPVFSTEGAFIIFAISDALALFSSVSSILSFLSVLTSRYGIIDFFHTLPKRLIIDLITLFISVTSVIVAFSAAFYLVFGKRKAWFLIVVATMACLPVTLFVLMQLPLFLDMVKSTYGHGIVAKPNDPTSLGLKNKMREL